MRSALPSYSYCVMMTVPAGDMSYCFLLFTHPPPTRLLFLSNEDEIRALAVVQLVEKTRTDSAFPPLIVTQRRPNFLNNVG